MERKEATLVELDIIYKYHAPDERPLDATTIATDTMDVEDSELWTNLHNLHPVGHVISLRTDDPDEYGEQPKEYVVVARCPLQAPIGDSGLLMAALTVVVTDA